MRLAVVILIGLVVASSNATRAQAPDVFSTLTARVSQPPRPLIAAGRRYLAYEIYVTNVAARDTTIDSLEVRQTGRAENAPLLRLEGAALSDAMRRFGPAGGDVRTLPGGRAAVVFVWIALPASGVPASLTHRMAAHVGPSSQTASDSYALVVSGIDVAVSAASPVTLAPPLEGDHWLAANGPDNNAGHRRATFAFSGDLRISQRFAIDWIRLFDEGRTWRGDPLKNASYRAYGARALAVADGVVAAITDGIPENVPDPTRRAVPITPSTLGGNSVILDLGNRLAAFYAHLQPGSLLVKKGDRVRRGQPLGLVGNTGNSSEPHLHFHLSEGNASFDAEGVPYVFSSFDEEATADEVTRAMKEDGNSVAIDAAALGRWSARQPEHRRGEMLLSTTLVRFPAR